MQTAQTLTAPRARRAELAEVGLGLLAVAMLAVAFVFVAYRAAVPSDGGRAAYVTSSWTADGFAVGATDGGGPLKAGDVVAAVGGTPLESWADQLFDSAVARPALDPGSSATYEVLRDGRSLQLRVPLEAYPLGSVLLANWGTLLWLFLMITVAAYLYLRRPGEAAARALLIGSSAILGSSVPWMLGIGPTDMVAGAAGPVLYLVAAFLLFTVFWSALIHFALVFPRPAFEGPWQTRAVVAAYAVPLAVQGGWIVVGRLTTPSSLAWIGSWTAAQVLLVPFLILVSIGLLAFHWRRSDAEERLRLRWIMAAGVAAGAIALIGWYLPSTLAGSSILPWSAVGVAGIPFPIAIGLAVRRSRLFGIETILHRSLVYGGLTAGIVLAYAASVVLLNSILPGDGPYAVTLLATGVAALVALPLRDRLQRGVSHLLYGDRDEPHRAIARLGERLEASLEPGTVLPMVAETVAEALRLPYAAIELRRDGGSVVAAAHGAPNDSLERLPLVHHGEEIGWLVLAQRAPDEPFSARDRALLADLARQAGAAAYAVRLTAELQRSRQQLVSAREEERRRLRRDLHDGVGPSLAGALLKLQAAQAGSRAELDALLAELASDTRRTIEDVRRLAYDLRPPVLDQLGLVGALREEARRVSGPGLSIEIAAPDRMPEVPAAVEVAAYRIGAEAMANVVHHSGAAHAWMRLTLDEDALSVEVCDDGSGLPDEAGGGVGLASMRERADELGGSLVLGQASEGGARICARLPFPEAMGHA